VYTDVRFNATIEYSIQFRMEMRECIFSKGQSKRLWNELFKVSEII